ncbi:L-fuconate dehydratase [Friedmanniella endophytica]|uniref:L-fuconate dehydratase n=1 Tax=Microlunatus kandeliicorticis TaxID=1759536 RepID=A0A7W3IR92_9ACTN|nr:enolase C-terminal domain-like protein [Microlunatus kandeliicorticis]MBA8793735.1 L-fuconate dehydratase [Microlunatus kandeliicorticis]
MTVSPDPSDPHNVITELEVHDVRFPTSRHRDGSDAMNPFPDYSAAYLVLHTSSGEKGYGLVFTSGRGNGLQAAAIKELEPLVCGTSIDAAIADTAELSARVTNDGQLRWLGPQKGAIHMAAGAVVNAVWDLAARRAGKPLWQLLSELSPEQLVGLVDFRYLRDALTEDEALALLRAAEPGKAERTARLLAEGHPAYTTTPGWLGYDDDKLQRLCKEAVADGFGMIKLKVGADPAEDVRRLGLARAAVGSDVPIGIDANQVWGVAEAIEWVGRLGEFDPYWIEEPTSPDDILGHAAVRKAVSPIKVVTGEQCQNVIMFKQLLQADAIDAVQLDACRVGGVNELVAIILLAAKFGVPVCPHAGGVGLCELVQHFAMFDYVAVAGSWDDHYLEYVDHLHEHFVEPVVIENGRYVAPRVPGGGAEMKLDSIAEFTYPDGPAWRDETLEALHAEPSFSAP